jgi:hypothetical protein
MSVGKIKCQQMSKKNRENFSLGKYQFSGLLWCETRHRSCEIMKEKDPGGEEDTNAPQ